MSGPRMRERRRRQGASRTKRETVTTENAVATEGNLGSVEQAITTEAVSSPQDNLREEGTSPEPREISPRRSEKEQVPNLDLFGEYRIDGQIFGKEGISGGGATVKKEILEELINQAVENSHL